MVKQINLQAHKLSDEVVQTGISAIRAASEQNGIPSYISGGMGVQVYLPENLRRESVDLDFNSLSCGKSSHEFQESMIGLVRYLANSGYTLSFRQKDTTFDYNIKSGDMSLLIQHPKRSPGNFERCLQSFQREADAAREFSYRDGTFKAISPEDITIKKSNRILRFIRQYQLEMPGRKDLESRKANADEKRVTILTHLADESPEKLARDIADLRVNYDCFDIQALGQFGQIDDTYLKRVAQSWSDKFSLDEYRKLLQTLNISL